MKTPTEKQPEPVKCCCHECDGSGHQSKPDVNILANPFCKICKGAGTVIRPVEETATCAQCLGTGDLGLDGHCHTCAATGRIAKDKDAPFHVLSQTERGALEAHVDARLHAAYEQGYQAGLADRKPAGA